VLTAGDTRTCKGYTERDVGFEGAEGHVPALLLIPDRSSGGGVVVHHQHASQWHLGKSEVAGRAGDPWQAFGPALATRGVTVLAADAPGFEDRRRGPAGTDPRPTDRDDYLAGMAHRLVDVPGDVVSA